MSNGLDAVQIQLSVGRGDGVFAAQWPAHRAREVCAHIQSNNALGTCPISKNSMSVNFIDLRDCLNEGSLGDEADNMWEYVCITQRDEHNNTQLRKYDK